MAKKEKAKPKSKKKPKSPDKGKDKDKDSDPSRPAPPPVRAHHNYEVNRPPFTPKITAERGKRMSDEYGQQEHEQQQKKSQGQSSSKSGGGGTGSSSGGGGGDAVKSALQAIVAFGDDTGFTFLDPRLADLLANAKKALQSSEE